MTKTLKRITGLCGSALLVLPLMGGMTQMHQVNANASRRRVHRTYRRSVRRHARRARNRKGKRTTRRRGRRNEARFSYRLSKHARRALGYGYKPYRVARRNMLRARNRRHGRKPSRLFVNAKLGDAVRPKGHNKADQYVSLSTFKEVVNNPRLDKNGKRIFLKSLAGKPSKTNTININTFNSTTAKGLTQLGENEGVDNANVFNKSSKKASSQASVTNSTADSLYNSATESIADEFKSNPSVRGDKNLPKEQVKADLKTAKKLGIKLSKKQKSEFLSAYSEIDSTEASEYASNAATPASAVSQAASSVASSVASSDPSDASSASSVASVMTSSAENSSAVSGDLDDDAIAFVNVVETAPISSSAKSSIQSEASTAPSNAASSFANSVNGAGIDKISNAPFQSAVSTVSSTAGLGAMAPSLVYSNAPQQASSSVSSEEANSEKGMSSSDANSVAPVDVTDNKPDADQSQILAQDQSAMSNMTKGITSSANDSSATSESASGDIKPASPTLEKTPEMLDGTTPLMSQPSNGTSVMGPQQIQKNNATPDFSNTFAVYQQETLPDGTLMDHVISYDSQHSGWIPDKDVQPDQQSTAAVVPSGTYHFKTPSKDATYELPVDMSWADPYIVNRTDAVGADSLKVTAARTTTKNGKKVTSYYVEDASHPFVNGWVNSDELAKAKAKNTSSKKADTPKATGTNATKFSVDIEGNLDNSPEAVNDSKAGADTIQFPTHFTKDQVSALTQKKGNSLDWKSLSDNFFGKDKAMNKLPGSATYYEQDGQAIYVPTDDLQAEEQSGKSLFHYVYKVDKVQTRKANKNAKYGDVVTVYYKRIKVSGPATDAHNEKSNAKVLTNKSNQAPSNNTQKSVTPPKK